MKRWKWITMGIATIATATVLFFVFMPPSVHRRPGGAQRPARPASLRSDTDERSAPAKTVTTNSDAIESAPNPEMGSPQNSDTQVSVGASDWLRFRGNDGQGVSSESSIPTEWSDKQNLLWKTELPGGGASSPIIVGDYVFVTSYSGYGLEGLEDASMEQLKRHISCIDRKSGKLLWTRDVDAVLPEDRYSGNGLPEHGYATNSPTSDGKRVYVFFGKTGVLAYSLDGTELWRTSVGKESGNRGWGTAASLLIYKDKLIVNASEESQAIIALSCDSGKELWRAEASSLELAYSTPVVIKTPKGRDDLVVPVPGEVWGLNPDDGKLRWFVTTALTGNLSPSVSYDDQHIYVFGGYRSSGSTAIRFDGEGDITKSHVAWTSRNSSYVASPVLFEGNHYWIDDRGQAWCSEATTGKQVYRERVPSLSSGGRPVYASPIVLDGKILFQTRWDGIIVIKPGPAFSIEHQNKFENDPSQFNATPAVGYGQLLLRSQKYLYAIGPKS